MSENRGHSTIIMYRPHYRGPRPHLNYQHLPTNQTNGLEDAVGSYRLGKTRYSDTFQALTEVVEHGRVIEKGQTPLEERFKLIIPDLNDLRLTVIYLKKQINRGFYPSLKMAIAYIEKYVAMAMQHAQEKGYLPKPNNEAHRLRGIRQWLQSNPAQNELQFGI